MPYIGPRVRSVRGRYINSADGVRRSYEPRGSAGEEAIEIWFFGGSTTWGEGQRDGHTIPSEVARAAERDGVVVRAVNFGERGYTNFQEFLLLEQQLAERPAPDHVVFFDGQNEFGVRGEARRPPADQPTHFQQATTADAFNRAPALPGQRPPVEPSVGEDYRDNSMVGRLVDLVVGLARPAIAHAGEVEEEFRTLTAAQTEDVFTVYDRSVDLAGWVAAANGVPAHFFWQPSTDGRTGDLPLPDRVHDLRAAFAGYAEDEVYIDGGHSNELGARLAGEAIWAVLEPQVLTTVGAGDG